MNIGIIGKSKFGNTIQNVVKNLGEIIFFIGKEGNISYNIDWVIIASSNPSHYKLVKHFLERNINVFCEKPPTESYNETLELITLAKHNNTKLYFDDLFLYNNQYINHKYQLSNSDSIQFSWKKHGTFSDNIFNNLTYHDLYLLVDLFGQHDIENLTFKYNFINKKQFSFLYNNVNISCLYNRLVNNNNKFIITNTLNIDLFNLTNNPLFDMFNRVLHNNVDFEYNNSLSLKSQQLLDMLNKNKTKVAVVGTGIFGLTSALKLKENNFDVVVFEKNSDILQNASTVNQYRLHRGYHYPRSIETSTSAKEGTVSFLKEFNCLSSDSIKNYYSLSKYDSLISKKNYINFLDSLELKYKILEDLDVIKPENTDLIIEVDEKLFNPIKLKEIFLNRIRLTNLNINFNYTFNKTDIKNFDYVINCTYANTNWLIDEENQIDYQFELCEKPVVKLSSMYKNKSIVIVDGPFMCIDPLGDTDLHLMGNVKHAIHSTNVGKFPTIPPEYIPLLNNGIIKNPSLTNIDKFINHAKSFFNNVENLEHIGSMYTIRTVLPNRYHDDARPSLITKNTDKLYSIFSGKIPTCVNSSNELLQKLLTT